MENAELIDLFRNVERSNHPVCNGCPMKYTCDKNQITRCLFGRAADALEAAEKRIAELEKQIPKWISVKDSLPNNRRPVIVYVPEYHDDVDEYAAYVGMAFYTWSPKGGFWCGTDGDIYGALKLVQNPTEWMELPEPPNCGAKMMFNGKQKTESKNIKSPLEYDYCGTPKRRYDIEARNKRVDDE